MNFISVSLVLFQLVAELGLEEAERVFNSLLTGLSHPPSLTCVRASTHLHTLQDIQHRLEQHLAQVCVCVCHICALTFYCGGSWKNIIGFKYHLGTLGSHVYSSCAL